MTITRLVLTAASAAAVALPAAASDLSYTFLDFAAVDVASEAVGTQSPVPGQTVDIMADQGDGISVGGSIGIGQRFYIAGNFKSSIVEVGGVVTNPLISTMVSDNFDLITTTIGFGFLHELGENFDIVAEVSYDSVDYDFGSFAGENFDIDDVGAAFKIGMRWNPRPNLELFAFGRGSGVGKVDLTGLVHESDTSFGAGLRWYFFEDLGFGFDYETGDVDTLMISMRFSFGDFSL